MATAHHVHSEDMRGHSAPREIFLLLLAVDVIVIIIYLLVLPSGQWEAVDTRVRAIASLIASGLTYFGLNRLLRKHASHYGVVLDSFWFRALLVLVTPFLWLGILPVWSSRFVFSPTQLTPPDISFAGRSRQWVNTGQHTSQNEPVYQIDGLLLRNYEYIVAANRKTAYYLPMIGILNGTLFHRPIIVQLPCAVQLDYVSGGKITYRRFQEDQDVTYGDLPGDGIVYLFPGHYDIIRIDTADRTGSSSLDVKCPTSDLSFELKPRVSN